MKKKNLNKKEIVKFTQFCNFHRPLSKLKFLKTAVQAFEARDFLTILGFFEAYFLEKTFLIKKRASILLLLVTSEA